MPNWCFNELVITGDSKQLKQFKRAVNSKKDNNVLCMAKLVGKPKDPDDWYKFNHENYGTKWDTSGAELYCDDEDELAYSFDTAWTPPIAFIERASSKYKDLTFRLKYEEPGCCFFGVAVATAGDVEDKCIEY